MKVVILCGGQGTRLREETEFRPKPMVEIGGRPILWHIMKLYAHFGLREFVLCLGYRGEFIKNYFLNYEAMNKDFTITLGAADGIEFHNHLQEQDWKVTLVDTGTDAMTGARVKRIERFIDGDDFMLTYGDGVANVDLAALAAFHRRHGRLATVTGVRPPSRFGELVTNGDSVLEFSEKPQVAQGWINGGFFILRRRAFQYLWEGSDCVLEQEPMARLARDGELKVFQHEGFWQCMDTRRDLQRLQEIWAAGSAPWKIWDGAAAARRSGVTPRLTVAAGARP